jgi:1-acyl-sn-glycerol-3-phosphate acyltransferase
MKIIKTVFHFLFSIYGLLTFIAIMFLALPFVLLATPFGVKGGNFIYKVCKLWAGTWYVTVGIWHKNIYHYPHNNKKQYIFVANHASYMDIPPIVLSLSQPVRALGKYEMVNVPIFGWVYKATVILVDRSSPEKRSKSVRALKAALNKGISIFIFPEGTFNVSPQPLKDFFDGAFRIAIETQTPIKPVLFVDALDRLHFRSVFSLTPGKSRAIFLQEIPVSELTANDIQTLKQQVYSVMEEGLKEYRNYE